MTPDFEESFRPSDATQYSDGRDGVGAIPEYRLAVWARLADILGLGKNWLQLDILTSQWNGA